MNYKNNGESLGPEDFLNNKKSKPVEEWGIDGNEYAPAKTSKAKNEPNKKLIIITVSIVALLILTISTIAVITTIQSKQPKQSEDITTDIITVQINGVGEEIKYVNVPHCVGLDLNRAIELLSKSFIEAPIILYEESEKPKGTVIYQSEDSGKSLPNITVITLFVSSGGTVLSSNSNKTTKTVPLEKVNIFPNKLTLEPGETRYITTSIEPVNATNANFFLKSSDESVVTVSGTNVVTSIRVGRAKIVAMNLKGEKLGDIDINVIAPATEPQVEPRHSIISYTQMETKRPDPATEYSSPSAKPATTTSTTVHVVIFDANGGSVSTKITRVESGKTTDLPTPQREYYRFTGWYTATSDGFHYTDSTPITSDITLYAHWAKNPVSGWVRASSAPADAEIVNTKYTYSHRYYETSANSTMNGWTKYNTERTSWGSTQGPVYSDPSNGSRNVWSEQYVSSTTKHYKYYHRTNGSVWGSDKSAPGWARHSIDLTYALSYKHTGNNSGYKYYGSYTCSKCTAKNFWLPDGTYDENHYSTRWYYQEPVYTYYYYQDINEESFTKPYGSEYSNIQIWVQYRSK